MPKPYLQGALDGLCGLYALINASRLADPALMDDQEECQRVFHLALRWLSRKHSKNAFHAILDTGTVFNTLRQLHRRVFQDKWPEITLHQPFVRSMPLENARGGTREFWSRMRELAEPNQGQGLFIGIGGIIDHWSVVLKITNTRIFLFDSGGYNDLPLNRCGPYEENGVEYVIGPGYVLLLKKDT